MLKPVNYWEDCMELQSKVPDHVFHNLSQSRNSVRERTKLLWEKRYSK